MISDLLKNFYIDNIKPKCLIRIQLVLASAYVGTLFRSTHLLLRLSIRNKFYLTIILKLPLPDEKQYLLLSYNTYYIPDTLLGTLCVCIRRHIYRNIYILPWVFVTILWWWLLHCRHFKEEELQA